MPERDAVSYARYVQSMKERTKRLALASLGLFGKLPRDEAGRIIGRQLLRCATAVGANYRAACRVRTGKEFAAKIRIVCEEADECQYWAELLLDSHMGPREELVEFHRESSELTAMFTKSLETTRRKLRERADGS